MERASQYEVGVAPQDIMPTDVLYKIIIVGDSNVGKSNVALRIAKNQFYPEMRSTIGLDTYHVHRQVSLGSCAMRSAIWKLLRDAVLVQALDPFL